MKLICIADTHSQHRELELPEGDVLVHAGDFTAAGTKRECTEFLEWFASQAHRHKILIAGNHEFYLEKADEKELKEIMPTNIYYLNDEGVKLENLYFWGSPVTPGTGRWAFNRFRGKQIRKHWKKIPKETDILITHTPPYGILDRISNKRHVGCEELAKVVEELQPKLHIFGHIHEAYGRTSTGSTTYLNTCSLDENYRHRHPPVVQEIYITD